MSPSDTGRTARGLMAIAGEKVAAHKSEASTIGAVYKFVLSGEGGGTFLVDLAADPGVKETEGEAECVITMTARDFVRMVDGGANPKLLVLSGKLKIGGDKALALKLNSFARLLRV